jgi:hypothetical protein
MNLPFTKYLVADDHPWLVGRGVPVNPEPTHEHPEPVRAADDPDGAWLTADGKAFDPPDDVATDIRGLPPARARLAQFVAWRRQVDERIANLDAGIDEKALHVHRHQGHHGLCARSGRVVCAGREPTRINRVEQFGYWRNGRCEIQ